MNIFCRIAGSGLLFFMLFCANVAAQSIDIVYPLEGHRNPEVQKQIIFGSITPPSAALSISSAPVKVYKNGAFIAYVPVSPGKFAFNCELVSGTTTVTAVRNIIVGNPDKVVFGDELKFDSSTVRPQEDLELAPGDWVFVSAKATPGVKADFSIKGLVKDIPMLESSTGSGFYQGSYMIQPGDKADKAPVTLKLGRGWSSEKQEAQGRVTVLSGQPLIGEINAPETGIRSSSVNGYIMFLQKGQRVISSGKSGDRTRLWLSETESGWVDNSRFDPLPQGSLPPWAVMRDMRLEETRNSANLYIDMSQNVPYSAEQVNSGLEITFYYTRNHTNWISYASGDKFVRDVSWKQLGESTCKVRVNMAENAVLWGYDIAYASGSLKVELRKPPVLSPSAGKPLKGLRIALDPGHSAKTTPPYDGAVGPMRTLEYETNLLIAMDLKAELSALGAEIVMTRTGDEDVQLRSRSAIAWKARSDVFLSIHGNAIADGGDPFAQPRGFTVYYYQPNSREFAKALLEGYQKYVPLPDEGLRYGDYFVIRMTQMPAVLLENGYLILPEQEAMLKDAAFRAKIVKAVVHGLFKLFNVHIVEKKVEAVIAPAEPKKAVAPERAKPARKKEAASAKAKQQRKNAGKR